MAPLEDEELEALIALLRSDSSRGEGDLYRRALEQFDRVIVSHVMDQAGGNLTKAAERLGLSRVTLRSKLRAMRHGVENDAATPPAEEQCC
ncbi:MAG TPA: helix-turn-helix domain-containing protein [Planctomycetaceae bacterium]|jgi:two-component system nitrogen regulation response regulator GlnG|nr:helix-turn-helix domain-containing protein [Planctomycetaceae bacterium]